MKNLAPQPDLENLINHWLEVKEQLATLTKESDKLRAHFEGCLSAVDEITTDTAILYSVFRTEERVLPKAGLISKLGLELAQTCLQTSEKRIISVKRRTL
jgi:hypothetical protein